MASSKNMMEGIKPASALATFTVTTALVSTLFALVVVGCDHSGRPQTPRGNSAGLEDGGDSMSEEGGPNAPLHPKPANQKPGPTFTAQPGDIQL